MIQQILERLEEDLEMCIQHLQETGNVETRLGNLFVGFILGRIYGSYQRCIHGAIIQRAKKSGDTQLAEYTVLSIKRLGMNADTLQHSVFDVFGNDIDQTRISVSQEVWKAYKNLIKIRNKAMHGEDIREGLDEVINLHRKAREVVYTAQTILLRDGEYGGAFANQPRYDSWN